MSRLLILALMLMYRKPANKTPCSRPYITIRRRSADPLIRSRRSAENCGGRTRTGPRPRSGSLPAVSRRPRCSDDADGLTEPSRDRTTTGCGTTSRDDNGWESQCPGNETERAYCMEMLIKQNQPYTPVGLQRQVSPDDVIKPLLPVTRDAAMHHGTLINCLLTIYNRSFKT